MKILITGKHSYIGKSFSVWVKVHQPSFEIHQITLKNIDLKEISFKDYDVILHVAGIAHITRKKKIIPEYFKVNRDLAIEVAKKAKIEGVKQFIFISSMAIYGDDLPIGSIYPIDIYKQPKPTNSYGQSKLEADFAIQSLSNNIFKTIILRIPMVYGQNAKGNFPKLFKFSSKFFIFPKITNKRSVIHINNLSRLILDLIMHRSTGVFFPQDKQYLDTIKLIKIIRMYKPTLFVDFFNFIIKVLSIRFKFINKVFGNKFYPSEISIINESDYQVDNIYEFTNKYIVK
jgi:UDP-glucose 4-epimerase